MKVLVTGASGRLGSCVCRLLLNKGYDFLAVDKVPNENLEYPVLEVDLLELQACEELLEGVTVLAHFANYGNWDSTAGVELYNSNVLMNMNLFEIAVNKVCERIIFSSSVQVLDGQLPIKNRLEHPNFLPYIPLDSEMAAIPKNYYALSKHAAESALKFFADTSEMVCVAFRFPLLVDSTMLQAAMSSGGMVRGNAYDTFAYLPVYSGAEAVVKATTADLTGYQNYFVASRDNLEQKPAQEIIESELSDIPCKKPLDEMDSLVDCSKVEAELRWEQPKSMVESLEKYGDLQSVRPYE